MPQPNQAPTEPSELPFKYVGGDPSIDFVNTVDWTSRGPERDRLISFERVLEWAEGAEILTRRSAAALRAKARVNPRHAIAAHRKAMITRHILWKLFSGIAEGRPTAAALDNFNRLLARALPHLRVTPAGPQHRGERRFELGWDQYGESLDSVLWPVLWAAASLIVSEEIDQIRICGSIDCGWMYVDRSRNGLRRWCQMETCGTLEKNRRRYQRS
jgi:predicted RNA-binding Zn ribbon-like protein